MVAMEQRNVEGYETDSSSNKVEGVLVNTMHRAASVEDLFAPLWGLNVHANGEPHPSSTSASAARPSPDRSSSQTRMGSSATTAAVPFKRGAAPPAPKQLDASSTPCPPTAHRASTSVEERKGFSGGTPKSPLPTGHASVSSSAPEAHGSRSETHGISEESSQQHSASERASEAAASTRESYSTRSSSQLSEVDCPDVKPSFFSSEAEPVPACPGGARSNFSTGKSNSSGGVDGALPPSQSTSDDDQLNGPGLDERKQKRMLSNRESARRSRLRKQQHLDELRAQVAQLRAENTDMMARYGLASHRYSQITGENHVLRTHAVDLSRKLQQAHHIVASQHPNGLRALGIQPGHVDPVASGHLCPYYQPLVPDLLP